MDLILRDNIGKLSRMPWRLCIDVECLIILRSSLAAVAPEEGCALLIGESSSQWSIRQVWPCCNVWKPGLLAFPEPERNGAADPLERPSRCTRFALDPREQIAAQRWARARGWQVLGSAHSHPGGQPVPSAIDRRWAAAAGVMLIDAGRGGLAAWWLQGPSPDAVHALPLVTCHTIPAQPHSPCLGDDGTSSPS